MKWYITGDLHFGHDNIIIHSNRPFKNVDHMDNTLIRNWNQRVKPCDTIIINGDFYFRNKNHPLSYYLDRLNGKKIFIRGNHDNNNGVKTKITSTTVYHAKTEFYIVHRPQHFNVGYDINLTAHTHEKWKIKKVVDGEKVITLYNVGVDVNNFMPISFDEIIWEINYGSIK